MIFFRKLAPFFSSGLLLIVLEFGYKYYTSWIWWFLAAFIIINLTILFLNKLKIDKEYFGFIASPLALIFSCLAFISFQEKVIIIQTVIVLSVFIYLLFIRSLTIFFFRPQQYITYSLENICSYSNLLAIYFAYVCVFAFYTLSIINIYLLILLVVIFTFVIAAQTLWINKIQYSQFNILVLFLSLMIAEIFWVMHYWPTSFFVNGLVLTIFYYVCINISKLHYMESLSPKVTKQYLVASGFIIIIILATAQWT